MTRRRNPYPGITRVIDRHGKTRWRFRRKGFSCYLTGAYHSAEFRAAYDAALSECKAPNRSTTKHGTIKWLCERYQRSNAYMNRSDISKNVLRRELDWLCQQAGDLPFARLGVKHVEALMMMKQGPAAQNKVKKNMSLLLNFAIKRQMGITFNPAKYADKAKENPDGFYTWTAHDVALFIDYWDVGTKARLAFELIRWTGASRQDVIRLGRQNIKNGRIQFSRGKTDVSADLPLHSDLRRELDFLPGGQMLFLTHSGGKPYKPTTFGNWFKDQCVSAGVLNGSAHGLRKWLATELANAGRSPDEIRAVLAHKTNTEGQTYTKKADRARLASSGFDGLSGKESEQKLSNLPVRLDKTRSK